MTFDYRINFPISTDQFIAVLQASTLGERRPVADRVCMEGMVSSRSLMATAWVDDRLVGVTRSRTDFHTASYLSDLAVDVDFQRRGIGTGLLWTTQSQLGPRCWILAGSQGVLDTKS